MSLSKDVVQFKGLDLLTDEEKVILEKIVPEYYEKIKRSLHNIIQIQIHFKAYEKTGSGKEDKTKRRKFDIHMKVLAPTKNIFSSSKPATHIKNKDWKFTKSLSEAFKNLENQIKKTVLSDKDRTRKRD